MPRDDDNPGLMPSLLDRLTDPQSAGTSAQRGYTVERMMAAVQRDLEELLNTRQPYADLPAEYVELHASVLTYGLPDLVSLEAVTPQQRSAIAGLLEAAVRRFEPRLRDVRATLLETGDEHDRRVRFRIEGRLAVEPAPEVAFDTILELTTGQYSVKTSQG
jgi:type VI secretion system protein ImpF